MSNLTKYDAARYALQQAVSIDEVKDIRNKAEAMAAYAKQANDTALVEWATELRVRAERSAGQMLAELDLKPGKKSIGTSGVPIETTLKNIGVTKNQSSRWQKLAAVPDPQFEQAVAAAKEIAGEVTTAAILRAANPTTPKPDNSPSPENPPTPPPPPTEPPDDEPDEEESDLQERFNALQETAEQLLTENTEMGKIFDADDKMAALVAENKTLKAQVDVMKSRIDGLMNEKNEAIRAAKSWQNKHDKLVKAEKKAADAN